MDNADLKEECHKYSLNYSESHIENIQILFDYIKQEEQRVLNSPSTTFSQDSFKPLDANDFYQHQQPKEDELHHSNK